MKRCRPRLPVNVACPSRDAGNLHIHVNITSIERLVRVGIFMFAIILTDSNCILVTFYYTKLENSIYGFLLRDFVKFSYLLVLVCAFQGG